MPQNVILNIDCGVVRPSLKGDWDALTTYSNMDLVKYNNTIYQCVVDNVAIGVPPENDDGEPNQGWVMYVISIPGTAGAKGDKGDPGQVPEHMWVDGTNLMFKNPDGTWGELVDLVAPANALGSFLQQQLVDAVNVVAIANTAKDSAEQSKQDAQLSADSAQEAANSAQGSARSAREAADSAQALVTEMELNLINAQVHAAKVLTPGAKINNQLFTGESDIFINDLERKGPNCFRLRSGWQVCYGVTQLTSGASGQNITFQLPFNEPPNVQATIVNSSVALGIPTVNNTSATFVTSTNGAYIRWMAIGRWS